MKSNARAIENPNHKGSGFENLYVNLSSYKIILRLGTSNVNVTEGTPCPKAPSNRPYQ